MALGLAHALAFLCGLAVALVVTLQGPVLADDPPVLSDAAVSLPLLRRATGRAVQSGWPKDQAGYIRAVRDSSLGVGGVRCAQLLRLREEALTGLLGEARVLAAAREYRTRIFGHPSKDLHDWPNEDRTGDNMAAWEQRFLLPEPERFPWMQRLVRELPSSRTFVHLLALGIADDGEDLEAHIERTVYHHPSAPDGVYFIGARFHIALSPPGDADAARSWMQMDGSVYTARQGELFYYCSGCAHLSYTPPGMERLNLVIDILFTEEATAWLFPPGPGEVDGLPPDSIFTRVAAADAPCELAGLTMPPRIRATEVRWFTMKQIRERPPERNAVFDPAEATTYAPFRREWATRIHSEGSATGG